MSDTTLTHNVTSCVSENWSPPPTLRPGPEMEALQKFHFDCKWTGTVRAGGMGPNSPEMAVVGQGLFHPIMNGRWLVGDFEQDQMVNGEVVITWQAHYIAGWNPQEQVYKIALVDSNGVVGTMVGRIEGNRFIAETNSEAPVKLQMVWELLVGGNIVWTNRCAAGNDAWFLIEEYVCTPLAPSENEPARPGNFYE